MRIILDRFKEPTARDEIQRCAFCGERFNYQQLDSEGFCESCRPDREDEDEKD